MTIGGGCHCYSHIYRVENWDPEREDVRVWIQTKVGSWVCTSNHCPSLLSMELPRSIMNSAILQYKKNWGCPGGVSKPHWGHPRGMWHRRIVLKCVWFCLIEGGGRDLPVVKLHMQRHSKWAGMGHDVTLMGLLLMMMAHITLERRSWRLTPVF